jgi:hypothetical protein
LGRWPAGAAAEALVEEAEGAAAEVEEAAEAEPVPAAEALVEEAEGAAAAVEEAAEAVPRPVAAAAVEEEAVVAEQPLFEPEADYAEGYP